MKDLIVAEAQLSRVLSLFPRVDSRVAGLFAVDAALIIASGLNVEASDLSKWYVLLPGAAAIGALAVSLYFLYLANFPDLVGKGGSLIYFAEIQNRSEADYVAAFESASEEDYRQDMLHQIWRNSEILCQKYQNLSRALKATLVAMIPFLLLLLATATEHSRFPILGGS